MDNPPLQFKSDFYLAFVKFVHHIECLLDIHISFIQCDGRDEFISNKFKEILSTKGISQRISCSHSPQKRRRKKTSTCSAGGSLFLKSSGSRCKILGSCEKVIVLNRQLWMGNHITTTFYEHLVSSTI